MWADTAPQVTLEQVLHALAQVGIRLEILRDFTCPGRGPHLWTSATIPHVRNQWCQNCDAKKPIPGADRLLPLGGRDSWL